MILKNATIVDIRTKSTYISDVAVKNGIIAVIGNYSNSDNIKDLDRAYLCPDFINAHCHVESSMAAPDIYCREELAWDVHL